MTLQSLIDRANSVRLAVDGVQHPRPTSGSTARINEHFGMILPQSLLEFTRCWRSSGSWLASLGNDYEANFHIIRINSYWRRRRVTRRLPGNLVIINLGYDEDFDCIDLTRYDQTTGEYVIQYWSPGQLYRTTYPSFIDYMDTQISGWEGQKTKKSK